MNIISFWFPYDTKRPTFHVVIIRTIACFPLVFNHQFQALFKTLSSISTNSRLSIQFNSAKIIQIGKQNYCSMAANEEKSFFIRLPMNSDEVAHIKSTTL